MRNSYQIYCDYLSANIKANTLDAVARRLENIAQVEISEEIESLRAKWQSDSMNIVRSKSVDIETELLRRASNIRSIADAIRRIARRNYTAEMRALEIARERGYGSGGGFR